MPDTCLPKTQYTTNSSRALFAEITHNMQILIHFLDRSSSENVKKKKKKTSYLNLFTARIVAPFNSHQLNGRKSFMIPK